MEKLKQDVEEKISSIKSKLQNNTELENDELAALLFTALLEEGFDAKQ
jgi:hypothetical protein